MTFCYFFIEINALFTRFFLSNLYSIFIPWQTTGTVSSSSKFLHMFLCIFFFFYVKREPFILYIYFPCVILHPAYIFWQMLWDSQWPAHSGALHLFSLITMRSAQSYTFPSHPKTQIEARLASTDSLHSLLLFSLSHRANPSSNSCPLAS